MLDLWRQKGPAPEEHMSIIEAKSNVAVRGDLDAVVREYAFPDVHIGAGEDESPYGRLKKTCSFAIWPST